MTDLALPLTLSTEQKRRLYDSAANHFFRELDGVKENTRSTSIERFYRFENAQFLENAGEWVRCLAHITPRKARLQLVYLFMGAFLWEGETINYAPCEAFLNLWERTRIHRIETERPRFGELLKEFNRIFPREIEREGKANALFQTRWERIEELTSLIEARLESDGKNDSEKLSEEEETRFTGSIAMLLGYRAMAHHFLGRSASPIYRRVCRQLRGIEDIAWAESYVRVELAYHELERGRLPEALAAIRTAYEYRDNEYVDGDYTDREIDARISQALGDVFWTLERLPEAFECWCLAIHEEFVFLWMEPTMLEIYTCEMYLLFCNRLADKLRLLAKQDMPAALRFSSQTQEFWQEYRSEEANVPLTPTQAETVKQLLSQNTPSEQEKKGAAGLYGLIFPVLPSARTFPNPRKGGKPSSDVPPLPLEAENLRRLDIFADRRLKELIAQEKQLASEMNTRKAGATRAK